MANTEQSKSHKAHKHKSRTALGREKGLWLASSCHQLEECSPFPPSTTSPPHKTSTVLAAPAGAASQGPAAGTGVCQDPPMPTSCSWTQNFVPPVLTGKTLVVEQGRERHLNTASDRRTAGTRTCCELQRTSLQRLCSLWTPMAGAWLRLRFLEVFLRSKTI